MKGIVLAGGSGTRLNPTTKGISKHLIPIYDKPMIYYPISTLMIAGIKEILIISSGEHLKSYQNLLGDGSNFGISFEYVIQKKSSGIAEAFILGEDFIGSSEVCLILGDNVFYGEHFSSKLSDARNALNGATIFAYRVSNPEDFGVVEFGEKQNVISLEEKPNYPKSNYAVTGLYLYDNSVVEIAKGLKPSDRGELEITDINQKYLERNMLQVNLLGRGFAWLDTGTSESLLEASQFVKTIEKRQGVKIACLEEIALNNGLVSEKIFNQHAESYSNSEYGSYLKSLLFDKNL